jgi:hypothetical protein
MLVQSPAAGSQGQAVAIADAAAGGAGTVLSVLLYTDGIIRSQCNEAWDRPV